MRNAAVAVLSAVLGLSLVAGAVAGEEYPEPAPPEGEERAALFAWFDGLEFPDVTRGDVVAVTVGRASVPGFVLEQSGDVTRVVDLDLREVEERPLPDDAPEWKRVTLAPLDLERAVRDVLADAARKRQSSHHWGPSSGGLPERARLVVLARACVARGLESQTHALLAEASRLPGSRDWFGTNTGISLRERVENDLEQALRVRVFNGARSEDLTGWRDAFRTFVRRFPRGRNAARARHDVSVLDRMIAEVPSIPSEEEALTLAGAERARALVERLRTMRHFTPTVSGSPPSVFAGEYGLPKSAADHLLEMGETAIPALVAALDDDTLTGLTCHGKFGWSTRVLTVGECAHEVLHRLAPDVGFSPAQFATWHLRKSAPRDAFALIDRIEKREEPLVAARELVAKHPDLAYWPVVLGWTHHPENLADVSESNAWIDVLCELDDPRVAKRLAWRGRRGGRLSGSVAAIVALERFDAGLALALAVQKAEYLHEESHATPSRSTGRLSNLVWIESQAAGRLVDFLAKRGRTDVLARRFDRQWPHVKEMIVRAVVRHADDVGTGDAGTILRAALADATPLQDRFAIERTKGVTAPRVNDAAAVAVNESDAERFPFTPGGEEAARDRQIDAMRRALGR